MRGCKARKGHELKALLATAITTLLTRFILHLDTEKALRCVWKSSLGKGGERASRPVRGKCREPQLWEREMASRNSVDGRNARNGEKRTALLFRQQKAKQTPAKS